MGRHTRDSGTVGVVFRGAARHGGRQLLTPWERGMAVDHGPAHTMTCFSRFWLSRPVARQAFADAVAAVAGRNPFLAVRRHGRAWRTVDFDAERQIRWSDVSQPAALRHQSPGDDLVYWDVCVGGLGDLGLGVPDLAETIGTLVVMRFPHAVADGLAATAVMRQVCAVLSSRPPHLPTQRDLDGRLTLGRTSRRRVDREIGRILKFFVHAPGEFAPDVGPPPATVAADIPCERLSVDPATTRALLARARAAGVTLNDVLVAALFRALAPSMDAGTAIRIAVPTSLRAGGNQAFCNQVSMVFLDRLAARVDDVGLLRGISTELADVKRWKLGRAMHATLRLVDWMSDSGLRWLARRRSLPFTAVLSNLGDTYGTADEGWAVRVVGHDLLPPVRPGMNVAMSAVGHDGRLSLTIRYARDRVAPTRARAVLDATLREAGALLQIDSPPA